MKTPTAGALLKTSVLPDSESEDNDDAITASPSVKRSLQHHHVTSPLQLLPPSSHPPPPTSSSPFSTPRSKIKKSTSTNQPSPILKRFITPSTCTMKIAGYVNADQVLRQRQLPANVDKRIRAVWGVRVIVVVAVVALAAFIFRLHQWTRVPYCLESASFTTPHIPSHNHSVIPCAHFIHQLYHLPQCRLCPHYATCVDSNVVKCQGGYLLRKSWTCSLLENACVPDKVKYARKEKLLAELSNIIARHAGAVECGEKTGHSTYMTEAGAKGAMKQLHV